MTLETSAMEVSFQPEPTPLEECRALRCESAPPRIALCDLAICGWGTVHYNRHDPDSDGVFRTGIAYIAPDPPPRLYASMHFALAYDASSGRLALSRFDGNSLETVWLDCRPQ
ncbi:MAG TPA: hypothetical protein VJL84_04215 [Kiloniellales bacterium]|nr:hypothetical protein [Kiloniellales bacterium]